MPLSPVLVIGCGGSGGKVVLNLRKRLDEELRRRGWTTGIPESFQFKWIDVPSAQEDHSEFGPALQQADYVGLANVDSYRSYDMALQQQAGPMRMHRLVGWRPTPDLDLPVKDGAGQMRAIGRAVALANASAIEGTVSKAAQNMTAGIADLDALAKLLKPAGTAVDKPLVIVVSSMAGGTGAGIFLDVCDLVRSTNPAMSQRILAVLFTAEIFNQVRADSGMPSNTLAAAAEMMNSSLAIGRSAEPLYNLATEMAVEEGAGPSATYVVGLQTMHENRSLASPGECYRAVTESLLAMMVDEKLQQDVLSYDAANKVMNQQFRGSKFDMLSESPGNLVPMRSGFISSFGSAKVSVGSARFGDWARDRLARSVIDYVVTGWRERGLELFDRDKRETATDTEIVDTLVARDRELFFSRCGLWEENEPDGTEHDEALEAIASKTDLTRLAAEFRNSLTGELQSFGQKSGVQWVQAIGDAIRTREAKLRGGVAAAIEEGQVELADAVVLRLREAVSEWMADYGLPVTLGLTIELRKQCDVARNQLRDEAVGHAQKASLDASSSMSAAFQTLGKSQCLAGSNFVQDALRKAIGPLWYRSLQMRSEATAGFLAELIDKVLDPLVGELEQVGRDLLHPSFVATLQKMPDGTGVSDLYAPPPSEFCLVAADDWGKKYDELLKASAGSVDEARSLVGAGGFEFGKPGARMRVDNAVAIELSGRSWLGRAARPVSIRIALRPDDVVARVRCWINDDTRPVGRFLTSGLAEYLSRDDRGNPVPDHLERLDRFNEAVTGARQLASPLFRVSEAMMRRVHPDQEKLETVLRVQEFPFDPLHPAREIVNRALFDADNPEQKWCLESSTPGVESILLVSRLVYPLHPIAVASLYQPIAQRWNDVIHSQAPTRAVTAFWKNNRARLLNEFIPLPKPSIEMIVRGWFVGRLLGMVTDFTEVAGATVNTVDAFGAPSVAQLPWPLLRHGAQTQLHHHRLEWLPALLEHSVMAMMLLSQDPHALDAYEALFKIGQTAETLVRDFIVQGVTKTGAKAQVVGSTAEERKSDFFQAVGEVRASFDNISSGVAPKLVADFSTFSNIPFGYELFPMFNQQLEFLQRQIESTAINSETRG